MTNERLEQLDQDFYEYENKRFEKLFAVRRDVRIEICVERRSKGDFKASAVVGNQMHYSIGEKPSYAFAKLINQVRWTLDRMAVERNFKNGVAIRLS